MADSARTPITPRMWWIVLLTSTGYFMVILDSGVLFTALPRMQRDPHASLASLQWTVNSYGIAFAAGIGIAAAVGDRFGRRRTLHFGLVLFTVSSAACALTPTLAELDLARVSQGLGAAAVLPLSLTVLTTALPPDRRAFVVGIYGGLAGLAVACGPVIGGLITDLLDWHWIFWINVPIGLVSVAAGTRLLPESRATGHRLDLLGGVLLTGAAVSLVWGLTRSGSLGWSSPQVLITLGVGVVLLAIFVGWERRAAEPILPPRLFRGRGFTLAALTVFLMSGATFATAFLVTQDFQLARGYGPLATGVRLLPFFGTPMIVSPIAGALAARIRPRVIMTVGLTLQAAGFSWVAVRGTLGTTWTELVLALLVAGIGISMALPVVPTLLLGAVPETDMGKASGVNYMAQRFGAAFAVAIASTTFTATGSLLNPADVSAGFRPAMWTCVVFASLAALVAPTIRPTRTGPARAARAAAEVDLVTT